MYTAHNRPAASLREALDLLTANITQVRAAEPRRHHIDVYVARASGQPEVRRLYAPHATASSLRRLARWIVS